MTFFYDDRRTPKAPPTRRRRWTRRIVWAVLLFAALIWAALAVLRSLGGNDSQLRVGVENSLQRSTGFVARIGDFHAARFYPVSVLDIGDVAFAQPGKEMGQVATLGSLDIETDFWDRFRGSPAIQAFTLKDFDVPAGLLTQDLHIDGMGLAKSGGGDQAALTFSGHYGAAPLTGSLAMIWHRRGDGRVYYTRRPVSPFTVHSSVIDAAGQLRDRSSGGIEIVFDHLSFGGQTMTGDFTLDRGLAGETLTGTLHDGPESLDIDLRWGGKPAGLTGNLSMPVFDLRRSALRDAIKAGAGQLFKSPVAAAQLVGFSGTIAVKELRDGNLVLGSVQSPVTLSSGALIAQPITGTIAGGRLNGQVLLKFDNPVLFGSKGTIEDMRVAGDVPVRVLWNVNANAPAGAPLLPHLGGEIAVLAAGGGKLAAPALNRWRPGLAAAVFGAAPPAPVAVDCMAADLPVVGGIANLRPLAAQLGPLRVTGGGTVDLSRQTLSLALAGKSGTGTSTAFTLRGDWNAPELAPAGETPASLQPVFQFFAPEELGPAAASSCAK